jgi:AraC-like DNA-binding protein
MLRIINDLSVYSPFIISLLAFTSLSFRNKKGDKSLQVLCYFMLGSALFFGINILRNTGYMKLYNYLHVFFISLSLISFPLAYIYFRSLTLFNKDNLKVYLHFIPAGLMLFPGSIFYFMLESSQRIIFLEQTAQQVIPSGKDFIFLAVFFWCFKIIYLFQSVFYSAKILIILRKHNKALNDVFSDISAYELNWVKTIILILIIWTSLALVGHFFIMQKLEITSNLNYIVDISISILIAGLYILGSNQKSIPDLKTNNIVADGRMNNQLLKTLLLKIFVEKQIFLNKNLTIWDVCREINSNRTYISNLINEEFELNFNCFVNKYRVEMAKKMLLDEKFSKYSIDGIGQLCGFNSIASFNRSFLKFENSSPGNFRKEFLTNSL